VGRLPTRNYLETNTNLVSGTWNVYSNAIQTVGTLNASFEMVTNRVPQDASQDAEFLRLRIQYP
jgi:hypothetical protein